MSFSCFLDPSEHPHLFFLCAIVVQAMVYQILIGFRNLRHHCTEGICRTQILVFLQIQCLQAFHMETPLFRTRSSKFNYKVRLQRCAISFLVNDVGLVLDEPRVTMPTAPKKEKPVPSKQQMEVLKAISQQKSVFVTGSAGTGKSFIVEDALQILRGMYGEEAVFVTASTGLAACAIGGTTLHSFSGVGIGVNETKEQLAEKVSTDDIYNRCCC